MAAPVRMHVSRHFSRRLFGGAAVRYFSNVPETSMHSESKDQLNVKRKTAVPYKKHLKENLDAAHRSLLVDIGRSDPSVFLDKFKNAVGVPINRWHVDPMNEQFILIELAERLELPDRSCINWRQFQYGNPGQTSAVPREKGVNTFLDDTCHNLQSHGSIYQQMIHIHKQSMMSEATLAYQFFLTSEIQEMVERLLNNFIVLPFGSMATGLCLGNSGDLDIVMLPQDSQSQEHSSGLLEKLPNLSYTEARHIQKARSAHLEIIFDVIKSAPNMRTIVPVFRASVPIVTFQHATGFTVDLSADLSNGLLIAEALYWLKHYDERFHPLLTVVRLWARVSGVNSKHWPPLPKSISNFNLTMLVVYYLQSVKVLPPLKDIHLERLTPDDQCISASQLDTSFLKDWSDVPESTNDVKLVQLLVEFFKFYKEYPFERPQGLNLLTGAMDTTISPFGNCPIIMQDPYLVQYSKNIFKNVKKEGALNFQNSCRAAFDVFDNCLVKNRSSSALKTLLQMPNIEPQKRQKIVKSVTRKVSLDTVVNEAFHSVNLHASKKAKRKR